MNDFLKKLGFTPTKAGLNSNWTGMELQEKEGEKDKKDIEKLFVKKP